MQSHTILYGKARASFNFGTKLNTKLGSTSSSEFPTSIPGRTHVRSCLIRAKIPRCHAFERSVNQAEMTDEDDDLCPVECVREFKTDEELFRILETAKKTGSLVVVDFYRTSCGSCKYIEQGFSKLCKGAGNGEAGVIFLKHNVSIVPWAFHLPTQDIILKALLLFAARNWWVRWTIRGRRAT